MPVLPDRLRDKLVYELKEKEGMSFREISQTLRISLGGVHKMYHRHVSHNNNLRSRKVDKSSKKVIDAVHARV